MSRMILRLLFAAPFREVLRPPEAHVPTHTALAVLQDRRGVSTLGRCNAPHAGRPAAGAEDVPACPALLLHAERAVSTH